MKTLFSCIVVSFLVCSLSAQEAKPVQKKDSIFYKGKYYLSTDPEYKTIRPKWEKSNFETAFMPGLSYSVFIPKNSDSAGNFMGFAVEYLIYAKIYQNDKPGPSHVRWYGRFNMLKSDKEDISDMFNYAVGISLSIEKNPGRTLLVPYFGLEFGGLSQKKWGTIAEFTPTLGLHLVSQKNLFINLQGGYVYPITNFDLLQGWNIQAGVNFALW